MGSGASINTNDLRIEGAGPSSAYIESLNNAKEGKSDKNIDMRYAIVTTMPKNPDLRASMKKQKSQVTETINDDLTTNKQVLNIPGEGSIVHNSTHMNSMDDDAVGTGSPFIFLPTGKDSNDSTARAQLFVRPADTNPLKGDVLYFVGS